MNSLCKLQVQAKSIYLGLSFYQILLLAPNRNLWQVLCW
ncbi:Uncharacterised protein [Vibrio cholerae]|nr:Uncharacterised protein [Vibrio cholerae]